MKFTTSLKALMLALVTSGGLSGTMISTEVHAAGYDSYHWAKTANFPHWDRLNVRKWPAAHSKKLYKIKLDRTVTVERCILKSGTDWCLIHKGHKSGWVNGNFIQTPDGRTFATPHWSAHNWH